MAKNVGLMLIGVVIGLIAGYFLHASLAAPLGSNVSERRVLSEDLSLDENYFFGERPPVLGTIRKGSEVAVDGRKSSAAYISFSTVVEYERLARISQPVPGR